MLIPLHGEEKPTEGWNIGCLAHVFFADVTHVFFQVSLFLAKVLN